MTTIERTSVTPLPQDYAYPASRMSKTGRALCVRCRKLAIFEGRYHRSHNQPACLYYCEEHAREIPDAMPIAMLAVAIPNLIEAYQGDVGPGDLCDELQHGGYGECTRDMAQDALWLRFPDKYAWSQLAYYVTTREAQAEAATRTLPPDSPLQQKLDAMLQGRII